MNDRIRIQGLSMVSVYAVDFKASFDFYHDILGLTDWQSMGDNAAYFRFGAASDGQPYGMYLIGGRTEPPSADVHPARTTFSFDVPSVNAMFDHLRSHGVRMAMDEPMDMGQGYFWLVAFDPSGLPIEFLGRE